MSAGEVEARVGLTLSTAMKLSVVVSLMPAYELPLVSSIAVAAIGDNTLVKSLGQQSDSV